MLPRLLPLAVRILRDTAPAQAAGGWYDDLLSAVVPRRPQVREQSPDLAHELKTAVETLADPSRYVRDEVESLAECETVSEFGEWWKRKPVRVPRDGWSLGP